MLAGNIEAGAERKDDEDDSSKHFQLSSCRFVAQFALLNARAPKLFIDYRVIVCSVVHAFVPLSNWSRLATPSVLATLRLPWRNSPSSSDVIGGRPARRLSSFRRFISRCRAIGIEAHVLFRVRKRPFLFAFVTPLQDCSAQ
jgi:hypothetical protein